ncbi:MAG TPA: hypothetical protein VF144_03450 [Chitinophagaceae bacterium]
MQKWQFIVGMSLVMVSCSPAKMAVDKNNWSKVEEYSVKGRQGILINQKLSFGEYKTLTVKRSWTKGSSAFAGWTSGRPGYDDYSRIIGVEYSQKKQTVRFELTDNAANESSAFCVTQVRSKDFVLGNNPNSLFNISLDILGVAGSSDNLYWVRLYTKNENDPWEMILDNEEAQRNSKKYIGVISQTRDRYYTLHPVFKMEKKDGTVGTMPFGSIGYEIRNKQGKPLAAVSLIDKGVVYFNDISNDEKFLMANICTAILLQEEI